MESYLGPANETVSRVITKLRNEELIKRSRNLHEFVITDVYKLSRLAQNNLD